MLSGSRPYDDQQLTWAKLKPVKTGWYWMLNQEEEPGLPTIVQIVYDWESRHLIALIPASRHPTLASAVIDPQKVDALWAGPLTIPSVAQPVGQRSHRRRSEGQREGGEPGLAA